jgi:hypothetical protein
MDEAKLWVKEVIIEDALLPRPGDKARAFVAWNQCEGITGFLGAEDADEEPPWPDVP